MSFYKCRLDSLLVSTFVEKFHRCYRDGLDGGRDMRSFSGIYFSLVCLICLHIIYKIMNLPTFVFASLIFLATALLVAFLKPYKKTYMNVCDTLLLSHITIISILLSRKYFSADGTKLFAIILIPATMFKLIMLFKIFKRLKVKLCKGCSKQEQLAVNNHLEESDVDSEERQLLVHPTSTVVDMT